MNPMELKNRDRILEAIDQLRRRKARPDIQRICSYLFRRFHVNSAEAKADLDWCVANNHVLKVEYKGSISYRNAAKKFAQLKQRDSQHHQTDKSNNVSNISQTNINNLPKTGVVSINRNFVELLTNVFGELIVQEPDYLELGVPVTEIIDNILSKDSVRYTKNYIVLLLNKEVQKGNLVKNENGNYLMGPPCEERSQKNEWKRERTERSIAIGPKQTLEGESKQTVRVKVKKRQMSKSNNISNMSNILRENSEKFEIIMDASSSTDEKKSDGNIRVGGRRKKAKKMFDPSDTHVPRKRGRPLGSLNKSTIEKQIAKLSDDSRPDSRTSSGSREQGGVCSVCHVQNKRGPNDRMVACRECSNKAHYSCLNGEDMMLRMYPDNTWQCPHCKTCVVCYETSDAGFLIVCSVCADGYHASCHQPRITDKIKNGQRWLCTNCQMPDELKINEIQSNIGHSFTHKIISSEKDSHSTSNSGISSASEYNSPPLSPTPPPQLSPQMSNVRPESPNQDMQSDSQSNKDSESEDPNIDPSIPDATHWTPDEVYEYFAQFFPEEAKIFKEQEIDGRSLLLLRRMDVLTNLNLKLGPALKIYKHVVKLQVRRDDKSLYWL